MQNYTDSFNRILPSFLQQRRKISTTASLTGIRPAFQDFCKNLFDTGRLPLTNSYPYYTLSLADFVSVPQNLRTASWEVSFAEQQKKISAENCNVQYYLMHIIDHDPALRKLFTAHALAFQTRFALSPRQGELDIALTEMPFWYGLVVYFAASLINPEVRLSKANHAQARAAVQFLLDQVGNQISQATIADFCLLHLFCDAFWRAAPMAEEDTSQEVFTEFKHTLLTYSPLTQVMYLAQPGSSLFENQNIGLLLVCAAQNANKGGFQMRLVQLLIGACFPASYKHMRYVGSILREFYKDNVGQQDIVKKYPCLLLLVRCCWHIARSIDFHRKAFFSGLAREASGNGDFYEPTAFLAQQLETEYEAAKASHAPSAPAGAWHEFTQEYERYTTSGWKSKTDEQLWRILKVEVR